MACRHGHRATPTHTTLLDWRRRSRRELLSLLERGRADRFGAVGDLLDEAARLHALAPPPEGDEAEGGPRTPARSSAARPPCLWRSWLDLTRDLLVAARPRPELAPSGELGPELGAAGRAHRAG